MGYARGHLGLMRRKKPKVVTPEMRHLFTLIWRSLYETEYIIKGEDISLELNGEQKGAIEEVFKGEFQFGEMGKKVDLFVEGLNAKTATASLPQKTNTNTLNEWLLKIRLQNLN
eukprot:TRINITY_DN14163_c0_g1_i2.p2 TRINITY_DN14163_c0_g1~~TRINITY_DN14163_c0_g1_i2.p2  ORF type:complete len:114 (+),score=31.71 TRINITY_DN14163_c0_g1_i2:507-848(+)